MRKQFHDSLNMELVTITSNLHQQDQQHQSTSSSNIGLRNSAWWQSVRDYTENQECYVIPRPSTVPISTVASFTELVSDNTDEYVGGDRRNQWKNQQIRKTSWERLVRFVYFGQAILVTIIVLAWVAFSVLDLDSDNAHAQDITTTTWELRSNLTPLQQ